MRYEFRPLPAWTDPVTTERRSSGTFRASWPQTLQMLGYETERLGAQLVVVQIAIADAEIRRDGMPRATARASHPGVVISFESDHGPLRYATDVYANRWAGDMPGWQANVRAVALSLEALRAVDRHGVTRRSEQYVGFRALPAPAGRFATADEALRWMQTKAGTPAETSPAVLYRRLARLLHPDTNQGARGDWDLLEQAYQLVQADEAGGRAQ